MTAADDVVRFFHAVDDRRWTDIRDGLTDLVDTDYSSLFGGEPERLTADALIARWRALLPGFDSTQHLLGPVVVTDRATAACNVRAYHHLGAATWMVAGRYDLALHRSDGTWRIGGIVLHTTYEQGDRALVDAATARAAG
jgi:hypothetical protein